MIVWSIASLAVLIFSFIATWGLRRYALATKLMDVPNARSSHTMPTPRGGGVAIVVAFLVALLWMLVSGHIPEHWGWGLIGAGAGIALLGFLDDHGHIAARWRLLGHFLAAIWLLIWGGGFPPVEIYGAIVELGWIGHVLAVFYLVWMLNLYNFMDGIDGIASVEAIAVCAGGALIYWLTGHAALVAGPLLLAFAVAGFLIWNFPPAKIFMGDAGSGFLGLVLGALSIQAAWADPSLFFSWLILLGVFVVDATCTLVHRLVRGEKVYEAHRSHGYQFAARRYARHLPVTLGVLFIDLLWLVPLAVIVALGWLDGLLGVAVAYVPLVVLAIVYKAGSSEKT
ncbi:glycosyltransferase family 4 protein [Pseudomonas putida]|uniref:MraY family glycosyltransferase n=1 Tax=Pseudomonas TaxID=286 RepID=UPI001AF27AD5|nr:glycosyltransferase family 4 protein [Pseudomonas putida]MDD2016999.1 glycosyltransferase family 4 protein [Pseudomonas putida]QRI84578.1 glycosyltransferase family 4 protein [Pseudomonas putida]HDS1775024.1 glycosyltransferase family 4 protein [Pseudomonas putida]